MTAISAIKWKTACRRRAFIAFIMRRPGTIRRSSHLGLLADVLAGSKNSRLEKRLVDEKELATGVNAGAGGRELGGLFTIVVTVKPGVDPADVEKEIDAVLNELLESRPDRRKNSSGSKIVTWRIFCAA